MGDHRIAAEAERIRERRALGRSDLLRSLFDYLVDRSINDAPPKEVEIAIAVFGKSASFDISQDASVRVYVHRLRKKLDEFYAEDPPLHGRLAVPKGEYRIVFEPLSPSDIRARRRITRRGWIALALGALALNAAAWAGIYKLAPDRHAGAQVRKLAPWSAALRNGRPTILVVGDYYIFDEVDPQTGADRLVREYTINSARDLSRFLLKHPDKSGRYKDLGLSYLPVGTALALREIIPVLTPSQRDHDRLRVVVASELTPDMLKQSNIVYVGYLSGLGILREPVFSGSRFRFGDTYDELIDQKTQQAYLSQEGGPEAGGKRQDFGYFSTFEGPSGNRIIIVAGTRDTALMQISEAVTDRAQLQAAMKGLPGDKAFEVLYGVEGIGRLNLTGRLILASPLQIEKIWSTEPADGTKFPDG